MVDPHADLAEDVEVGPYCAVEADVRMGAGTVLRSHVVIRRYTSLGSGNFVDSFSVLGGEPQDFKFDPKTESYLRIGDHNVFREGVTISRATGHACATTVGNGTYWMAASHAGHNAVVGDETILVNGSVLAGHAEVGRRVILSSHAGVHQFCWIGDLVMVQGNAGLSMHVPPYMLVATPTNKVVGLNVVGLRRAPYLRGEDRRQIKEAFRITYRSGLTPTQALERMDSFTDWGEGAGKFRDFIRKVLTAESPHNRGLCPLRSR